MPWLLFAAAIVCAATRLAVDVLAAEVVAAGAGILVLVLAAFYAMRHLSLPAYYIPMVLIIGAVAFARFWMTSDPEMDSEAARNIIAVLTVGNSLAVLATLAMVIFSRRQTALDDFLDGVIVGIGVWLLAWVMLIAPALDSTSSDSFAQVLAGLIFPIAAAQMVLVATLMLSGLHRNAGAILVVGGLATGAVGALVHAISELRSPGLDPDIAEALFVAGAAIVGSGLTHPRMRVGAGRAAPRPTVASQPVRVLVAVTSLLAPMLLLAVVPSESTTDRVVRLASTLILIGLAAWRLNHLVRGNVGLRLELAMRAQADELTGLPNRAALLTLLTKALDTAWHTEHRPTVMLFDIDRFKNINDSLGHRTGDQILQVVGDRLVQLADVRGAIVGRLSGDEFVIVDPSTTTTVQALANATALREAFQQPLSLDHGTVFVTASIGIATAPANRSITGEDLLRNADIAMYRAKDAGRNAIALYDTSMQESLAQRMAVENALYGALDRRELRLFHQPIVDTATSEVSGFEALIRWQRADGSVMSPVEFVPIAEETGTIVPIGAWALLEGLTQLRHWIDDGVVGPNATMSVNVSPRQLADPSFPEVVSEALTRANVPPHLLWLEVTESMMLSEPELARSVLRRIRSSGVRIALDDFGTGYSSLSLLQQFPLQRIKIDRAFINGVAESGPDRSLVRTILAMGASLGLEVVAEGVESIHQLQVLRELGCTHAQGYLISHPVPPEAMRSTVSALEGLGSLPGLGGPRTPRAHDLPVGRPLTNPLHFLRPQN
jgi:diguanylate cyclase (GGDEF)-like protein